MKRNSLLPLGILSASTVVACVTSRAQQVYSQGVYSAGTTLYDVCSTTLSFAPYQYDLTERCWSEDKDGLTIMSIERKAEPGDVSRRSLEVKSGTSIFFMPLDSGPLRGTGYRSGDLPSITKGSGDLASVLMQRSRYRGGRTSTNALPVIQASWISGSRTNEDIFILEGDRFTEIQNFLEQAYGKPDGTIQSSESAGGNCRSINYSPAQIGVFLNLTRALDDNTIVSIVSTQ